MLHRANSGSSSAHHLAKPAVRLAWFDALAGFAVLLRCVHYPYLDIRVNREVKIKVRIWVSLPMIDVHQVLKAISNVLSGCLSHVAIVVIIKTHVRVFDS